MRVLSQHRVTLIVFSGYAALFIFPLLNGLWVFPTSWRVVLAYLLMAVTSYACRDCDRKFVMAVSLALAIVGLLSYIRAYGHWSTLGLHLDYEMPFATLAISLPAFFIFGLRRLRELYWHPS